MATAASIGAVGVTSVNGAVEMAKATAMPSVRTGMMRETVVAAAEGMKLPASSVAVRAAMEMAVVKLLAANVVGW